MPQTAERWIIGKRDRRPAPVAWSIFVDHPTEQRKICTINPKLSEHDQIEVGRLLAAAPELLEAAAALLANADDLGESHREDGTPYDDWEALRAAIASATGP